MWQLTSTLSDHILPSPFSMQRIMIRLCLPGICLVSFGYQSVPRELHCGSREVMNRCTLAGANKPFVKKLPHHLVFLKNFSLASRSRVYTIPISMHMDVLRFCLLFIYICRVVVRVIYLQYASLLLHAYWGNKYEWPSDREVKLSDMSKMVFIFNTISTLRVVIFAKELGHRNLCLCLTLRIKYVIRYKFITVSSWYMQDKTVLNLSTPMQIFRLPPYLYPRIERGSINVFILLNVEYQIQPMACT